MGGETCGAGFCAVTGWKVHDDMESTSLSYSVSFFGNSMIVVTDLIAIDIHYATDMYADNDWR